MTTSDTSFTPRWLILFEGGSPRKPPSLNSFDCGVMVSVSVVTRCEMSMDSMSGRHRGRLTGSEPRPAGVVIIRHYLAGAMVGYQERPAARRLDGPCCCTVESSGHEIPRKTGYQEVSISTRCGRCQRRSSIGSANFGHYLWPGTLAPLPVSARTPNVFCRDNQGNRKHQGPGKRCTGRERPSTRSCIRCSFAESARRIVPHHLSRRIRSRGCGSA